MSAVKVITTGPDTVLVNFKFAGEDGKPNGDRLPEHVATLLDEWQAEARRDHEAVPTDLVFSYHLAEQEYRQTLFIRPHGSGVWSWLLYCDEVKLSLSYGSLNGGVFCQARLSSHLLWTLGADSAMVALEAMLSGLMGAMLYQQLSELHLCVDLQGFDFASFDWLHGFVSKVVRIRERPEVPTEEEQEGGLSPTEIKKLEEQIVEQKQEGIAHPLVETNHRRLATLDFGSHGSPISAQLYNKSVEIKKHKKEWFEEVWAPHGYDPALTVWRWEFRFRRKFFASCDLNDAYEVLCDVGKLWAYATQEWLRMVDPQVQDSNVSRRPTHPVWEAIQNAYAAADGCAPLDTQGEYLMRKSYVLSQKPLQVLEQAAAFSVEESIQEEVSLTASEVAVMEQGHAGSSLARLALSVVFLWSFLEKEIQTRILGNVFAVRASCEEVPVQVIREMAEETLLSLPAFQERWVVSHLAPELLRDVVGVRIKRGRRMAKKRACIAGLVGYMRSAVALAGDELGEPGRPDLLSSLVWAFGEIAAYDRKKQRVHVEEVLKRQVAYGFLTAAELDAQRKQHGVELLDTDWEEIALHLDKLQQKNKPRRSSRSDAE